MYWEQREAEKLSNSLKDVDKLEKLLEKEYIKSSKEIEKEISVLFSRYAKDNKLTYADATKYLTSKEFSEWRYDLKTYMRMIEGDSKGDILLELNTLSVKSRISRLEEMHYQIDKHINTLTFNQEKEIQLVFEETVKSTYYTDIYNNHKFIGIGTSFAMVDDEMIRDVLSTPFFGGNYSERIWRNRKKLQWVLRDSITNMVTQGKPSREVAKNLAITMNNSYKNALRLINSEHAHVMANTTKASYNELGVEEYQYVATLDRRTSPICQRLDGKVFKVSEASQGINYPPNHANCRSTTVSYYKDDGESTRFARNEDGKGIEVSSSMTYSEWAKIYNVK